MGRLIHPVPHCISTPYSYSVLVRVLETPLRKSQPENFAMPPPHTYTHTHTRILPQPNHAQPTPTSPSSCPIPPTSPPPPRRGEQPSACRRCIKLRAYPIPAWQN